MARKRAHIIYEGTVQGVGFRWTVEEIAHSVGVVGWVQNRPEGTVEVVCEGEERDIDALINRVKQQMQRYIRSVKVEWEAPRGEFDTFRLKFFGG